MQATGFPGSKAGGISPAAPCGLVVIEKLHCGISNMLVKFAKDSRLCFVNPLGHTNTTQDDFDQLVKRTYWNQLKFSGEKLSSVDRLCVSVFGSLILEPVDLDLTSPNL